MPKFTKVVVVGAGIGGLTTAAILAKQGLDVTVLEAHVYPGGCAGTFYHKGFYFDAGATLAGGFYPDGPMDKVAQASGINQWPIRSTKRAMVVHLPDGVSVTRWGDERRWAEREKAFGSQANKFWRWQEQAADSLWSFALTNPTLPPQSLTEAMGLVKQSTTWIAKNTNAFPLLSRNAFGSIGSHLKHHSKQLRLFIDAQLLISAQATSHNTNALYAASALDLPRRGVVHFKGGMGALAHTLVNSIKKHGGQVYYKQEVKQVITKNGQPVAVETKRKKTFPADMVVFNLPPWNIAPLLSDSVPLKIKKLPPAPINVWGAFMVYVGVDASIIPPDFPLHHQIIVKEPLGEANSIFMSFSPAWDTDRAPSGYQALTISTHTALNPWWQLFETDKSAYQAQKALYTDRILTTAETILPNLKKTASLILPGTPVTFQRFTRRKWGWVGGFPQTNLFTGWGPRLTKNLWLVGDSIFPGQSTAAVAMGGIRVANAIQQNL